MFEVTIQNYKQFLYEYTASETSVPLGVLFCKEFKVDNNYLLDMNNEDARQEIFNKYLLN